MNKITKPAALFITALGICGLIGSSAAIAQTAPNIEGAIIQQGQISDLLDESAQASAVRLDGEDEIDGEAGIYVLRVNDIFFVGGSVGLGYVENPQRTSTNTDGSFERSAGVTAGVQTRLGGAVDFTVRGNVSAVEYFDTAAPSSRSTVGSVSLGMPIGGTPLYVGVTSFGGVNFDGDFNNGVAFYGASAQLGAGLPVGPRTVLRPGVGVTRQWSQISENNSTSASASIGLLHGVSPDFTLSAEVQLNRVWYDDFYEDVISVSREDWQYSAGLSATYDLTDWLSLSASAEYQKRDSSFFLSAYDGFEGSLLISARHRF